MFKTGARLLVGGAVLATIAAVVYGVVIGGALGTVGLVVAAMALTFLAGVDIWAKDSDVSAMDPAARVESAAAVVPPRPSMWPAVGALAGVLVVIGLVTYPVVFIFGLIVALGATVEWMVQAWSERASGDVTYNATVRTRIAHPLEFPLLAAVGLGIVIYSFSRIMLFLSKTSGPVVFGFIAALILLVGFFVAFRPGLRTGAVGAVSVIAALGLVAGGAAAALEGERDLEPHETTGDMADLGECSTTEKTEADERASQAIGDKANITGEIILRADETLVAKNLGVTGDQDTLVVTRANATNVRFTNQSSEERRLVLDLGTRPEVDAEGQPIEGTEVPSQICTALADEGGSQFLTFSIDTPSALAEQKYRFVIAGLEGTEVEVAVS